jgi:hypothetical protein
MPISRRIRPRARSWRYLDICGAVTNTFIEVQQSREEADYDTGQEWDQTDVEKQIDAVGAAFESWKTIREEPIAQAYLMSLLGKRPRSE